MNGFIGIKTNWYTKVKNTYMRPSNLTTSHTKLDYTTYKTYKQKINI